MTNLDALVIELAWTAGREYIPPGLAEVVDDARLASITPPDVSSADRVAGRVAVMEQCAARVADEGRRIAARNAEHDRRTIDLAREWPPITSWEQIRADVTPSVWMRIWGDLAPATQRENADLAPAGWARNGAPAGRELVGAGWTR